MACGKHTYWGRTKWMRDAIKADVGPEKATFADAHFRNGSIEDGAIAIDEGSAAYVDVHTVVNVQRWLDIRRSTVTRVEIDVRTIGRYCLTGLLFTG